MVLEPGPRDAPPEAKRSASDEPELTPGACVYAGERVRTATTLGTGWAALTTHRLLVYDPASDGERFAAVDRPNVTRIDVGTTGGEVWLRHAPQLLFYGIASLVVALTVRAINLDTATTLDSSVIPGLGGLVSLFDLLVTGLEVLATGLVVAAFVFLVAGVGAVALYLHARQPALVVDRAGDDPLRVATTSLAARDAAADLRVHLDVEPAPSGVRTALADAVDWPSD